MSTCHESATLTVAMSMDAVASSMMRILLFRTKARAKQKSCLWPWLKFSPPSVMQASENTHEQTSLGYGWFYSSANDIEFDTV